MRQLVRHCINNTNTRPLPDILSDKPSKIKTISVKWMCSYFAVYRSWGRKENWSKYNWDENNQNAFVVKCTKLFTIILLWIWQGTGLVILPDHIDIIYVKCEARFPTYSILNIFYTTKTYIYTLNFSGSRK